MLVLGGDREVAENQHEDEDVVHGERVLDDVPGEKFQGGLRGRRIRLEARGCHEARVAGKLPERVPVQQVIERERQDDPDSAPGGRLTKGNLMRVPVEHA